MIINATTEQLKILKGIVYLVINKVNGKKYVGQTGKTFLMRYMHGGGRINRAMKNDLKRYGWSQFQVDLLNVGVSEQQERWKLEVEYIKKYNCLFPHGYNFQSGGQCNYVHEESKKLISEANASKKGYKLKDPNGSVHEFKSLKKFADERGLSYWNIYNVVKGLVRSHKGYCLPKTQLETPSREDKVKIVKNEKGDLIEIPNIRQFCLKAGLHLSNFYGLLRGHLKEYAGYTVVVGSKRNKIKQNKYKSITLEKSGQSFQFTDITKFGKDHSISPTRIYALARGTRKMANGFRLKEVDLL